MKEIWLLKSRDMTNAAHPFHPGLWQDISDLRSVEILEQRVFIPYHHQNRTAHALDRPIK